VGQVARYLVLSIDDLLEERGSPTVRERREMLGGKGANQGVACRQLGARVELVGVVSSRPRPMGLGSREWCGARTALLLDFVGPPGVRMLIEDVDEQVLLRPDDDLLE
jgi:ribokinase